MIRSSYFEKVILNFNPDASIFLFAYEFNSKQTNPLFFRVALTTQVTPSPML